MTIEEFEELEPTAIDTIDQIGRAFAIFAKYGANGDTDLESGHEEIWAGPTDLDAEEALKVMNPEEIQTLVNLGWDIDDDSFHHFV